MGKPAQQQDHFDSRPDSISSPFVRRFQELRQPPSLETELQWVKSSAGLQWERYVHNDEPWWHCENGDHFFEHSPGPWKRWQDEAGVPYWHHSKTDEWFHLTARVCDPFPMPQRENIPKSARGPAG